MAEKNKTFVIFSLFCNMILSILIVVLNKWIYTHYNFPNITMTCVHFVFTTLGLILCQFFNLFQPKSLPVRQMVPLTLTFCGFVVFMNLSLQNNTIGTYQLIKTMTTPGIIVIQTYSYRKKFSMAVKLSLVIINICYIIIVKNSNLSIV